MTRPLTDEDVSPVLLDGTLPLRLTEVQHDIATHDALARIQAERADGARLVVDGNATCLGLARTERAALQLMQLTDARIHDDEIRRTPGRGRRGPLSSCPRPRLADYEVHLLRNAYVVIPRRRATAVAVLDSAGAVL